MLNKCKTDSLAVKNQVDHFCKTTAVFGQVPDFHLSNHTYTWKERKLTSSNIVTSSSSF